jgi:hypothetical protein
MLALRTAIFIVAAGLLGCGTSQIGGSPGDPDAAASGDPDAASAIPDAAPEPPDAAPGTPDAAPPAKRVVPIYITASDEPEALVADHVATYNAIVGGIRSWYTDTLGSPKVRFYAEPVRVMHGHFKRAEWDDFGMHGFKYPDGHRTEEGGGCAMYYGAEWELKDGGLLDAAGLPPLGSGNFVYYAINGGGMNGSCGSGGYLGASELQLLINAKANCPAGRKVGDASDCSSPGAVAHELGHGFGLPHGADRPKCSDGPTLMDVWWMYDDGAKLCTEDKADLRKSGWFFAE